MELGSSGQVIVGKPASKPGSVFGVNSWSWSSPPDFEMEFNGAAPAVSPRMTLPSTILSTDTFIQFAAYIPNDAQDSETAFSFYGVGNVPRILLKFKPDGGIMQIQGKTDGNLTIDEDTAAYAHFDAWATIKLDFSGSSIVLSVNGSPFHTYAHGQTITPSLFKTNTLGANDTVGNQALRAGCKIKSVSGLFTQGLAFKTEFPSELCVTSDTVGAVHDIENKSYWTQPTAALRPVVTIL